MLQLKRFVILFLCIFLTACGMFEDMPVWLQKVDFEVSPDANNRSSFACHIVLAYNQELADRLKSMDARSYFSNLNELERTYKDSFELFKYDLIPGKNKVDQQIQPRSYRSAKAAYVFAKYTTQGRFAESLGNARRVTIRFMPYKMEVIKDISLENLTKTLGK